MTISNIIMTLLLTCKHVTCNIQRKLVCILFIHTCIIHVYYFTCFCVVASFAYWVYALNWSLRSHFHTLISFSLSCFIHNTNYNTTSYHTTITAPSEDILVLAFSCLGTRCLLVNENYFFPFILKNFIALLASLAIVFFSLSFSWFYLFLSQN